MSAQFTSPPKIYGLIGYPVKHSLSDVMHNAAFKTLKINAEYKLFEVEPVKLEDFLLKNSLGISGFNITIPHKVKAKEILEKRFPFPDNLEVIEEDLYYVKVSGAINTVKRQGDKIKYYNTDATGFLRALEEDLKFQPQDKEVLLIGCGGAGRAVIAALGWKNTRIRKIYVNDIDVVAINSFKKHFLTLSKEWQKELDEKVEFISVSQIPQKIKICNLLVNASPIGMREDDTSIIDKGLLHKELSVYDLVYNRETQLVKDAKSRGVQAVNGLGMLLHQGTVTFELWTGQKAPIEIMRQALKEAFCK